MLPAILGAAARYGIPALGSAIGSMLPDLIHAFQGGQNPDGALQAIQPHYQAMLQLGMSPDQAKAALAGELKASADPKDHPVIDGILSAVGAVAGGMLAHKLMVPKSFVPAKTDVKERQLAVVQQGGPSTPPANPTGADQPFSPTGGPGASGGANKMGSPQMQTQVPNSAYPQTKSQQYRNANVQPLQPMAQGSAPQTSQYDTFGVQRETPSEVDLRRQADAKPDSQDTWDRAQHRSTSRPMDDTSMMDTRDDFAGPHPEPDPSMLDTQTVQALRTNQAQLQVSPDQLALHAQMEQSMAPKTAFPAPSVSYGSGGYLPGMAQASDAQRMRSRMYGQQGG